MSNDDKPATATAPVDGAVLTNPYTGQPRDYRDVESDPAGTLIVEPGKPLKAASPPAARLEGPTEVEWMMACNEIGGPDVAEEIITRAFSIAEVPRSTPAAPGIDWPHVANEYADAVCSALDGLKCIRDDLMTVEAVIENVQRNIERIQALHHRIDASPKGGSDAEPIFYIQDTRSFVGNCPMWWAPNGAGYVTRLDEAGRFTEQEAIRQNRSRDTDVPWPCAEIDKLGRITVDMQHMRPRSERLAELQATSAEVGE